MAAINTSRIERALDRHAVAAVQVSGGRDSVAMLYALRPWWDRLRVYHLDTGDRFPELAALMDRIAADVSVEAVRSDAHAVHNALGLPSDLVPVDNEPIGRMVSGKVLALQSRYSCCWQTIMAPMHQRMLQDGVTLIFRGQRATDFSAEPVADGTMIDGVELAFPIHQWTDAQVDAYVDTLGLPMPAFYAEGMRTTPDCMHCTAWMGDGRLPYLRRHHPEVAVTVESRIQFIKAAIQDQLATFEEVTP